MMTVISCYDYDYGVVLSFFSLLHSLPLFAGYTYPSLLLLARDVIDASDRKGARCISLLLFPLGSRRFIGVTGLGSMPEGI
jgi:hypothetical protein